jgi:hypothetical protein
VERKNFYATSDEEIKSIPPNQPMLIVGDLITRTGNDMIPGIKHRFDDDDDDDDDDDGELLVQFCIGNSLGINSTFFDHKMQCKYSSQNTRTQQ